MTTILNQMDVGTVRKAMGLCLNDMIALIIGDSRLKDLLVAGGHSLNKPKGRSLGDVSLEKRVITRETKVGLLVASAAERAYRKAEKAGEIASKHESLVRGHVYLFPAKEGFVEYRDNVFEAIGAESDPEILRYAQGVWMSAQMYLNNEIMAVNEGPKGYVDGPFTLGPSRAEGFKKTAVDLYRVAAEVMRKEGHIEAADKLEAVAAKLGTEVGEGPTPRETIGELSWNYGRGGVDLAIVTRKEEFMKRTPFDDVLDKLRELTKPPASLAARPEAKGAARVGLSPKPK